MTPELAWLVDEFAERNGDLADGSVARGQCYTTSWQFLDEAQDRGIIPFGDEDHEVLQVYGFHVPHYIIRVGGDTIDFTARQFDEGADFPVIATTADYHLTVEAADLAGRELFFGS